MTPFKSNLFIHFGNANHEYFKPMLNTNRTTHLRTLTALSLTSGHTLGGVLVQKLIQYGKMVSGSGALLQGEV